MYPFCSCQWWEWKMFLQTENRLCPFSPRPQSHGPAKCLLVTTLYCNLSRFLPERSLPDYTFHSDSSHQCTVLPRPRRLRATPRGLEPYGKVGAGVSEQWGVSEHLLVASYFFFETTPPLLLVGLHVEATTSNRTAHFWDRVWSSALR